MTIFEKIAKMAPAILCYVPFLGFLVSGKKVLPFLGHNSAGFGGFCDVLCPFFGVSCFRKKGFAIFGTCCKIDSAGGKMFYVLFLGILILKKKRS